jgi:hypothetical protein
VLAPILPFVSFISLAGLLSSLPLCSGLAFGRRSVGERHAAHPKPYRQCISYTANTGE